MTDDLAILDRHVQRRAAEFINGLLGQRAHRLDGCIRLSFHGADGRFFGALATAGAKNQQQPRKA
jgi:hypothetical protein